MEEDEHQPVSSVFFQEAFKFLQDLEYMGERSTKCKKMERDRKGCLPLKKVYQKLWRLCSVLKLSALRWREGVGDDDETQRWRRKRE